MEIYVKITLDSSWDEYKDVHPELFAEDLYPLEKRTDGIQELQIVAVDGIDPVTHEKSFIAIQDDFIVLEPGEAYEAPGMTWVNNSGRRWVTRDPKSGRKLSVEETNKKLGR